ncbi:MAG TPA: Gfo/Idh/MocA family oxidoreductase [Candidatus Hydrogenedentes bacterium]|nr:Gfo/Idh/MocA family oxidoreductase [Candidatus Hydrogenedentota bacterium]
MNKKIRWGVLGSGGIAKRRTIPEGITQASNAVLTGVFDVNAEVNRAMAAEFGAAAAESVEALLTSDIDAVYVATPVNVHYEQVLACARAGKHVLCEKPLGMTPREAEEMVTVCKKAGVQLVCAFMMRFHAQHQAALKLIEEGRLGKPVYGRAQLSCWYPAMPGAWRQDPILGGGGSLIDMGGHCIDLLEMFFGPVKRVACMINTSVQSYASEDSAVALLYFENGAMGSVDAFFCIPDNSSKNILELYGSKGSILARGTIGQGAIGEMTAYLEGGDAGYDAQQARATADGLVIAPEPVNMYRAEIEAFSQDILDKKIAAGGMDAGLRSQLIITACYESARTGRCIEIGT